MIELTEEQIHAIDDSGEPLEIVNPRTHQKFVLIDWDHFQRLNEGKYDHSIRTREELEALGWETAERSDWEDYTEKVKP